MRLHLDTSELNELAAYWQKSPKYVGDEVNVFMISATEHLEGEWKERARVGASGGNGGGYRSSISAQPVQRLSDRVIGTVGTFSPYAIPIELGTKPHMPPVQPIQDWVRSKLGIYDEDEQEGIAWAIAKKIQRDGTEAQYIARDTWQDNYHNVEQNFHDMLVRIRNTLGEVKS